VLGSAGDDVVGLREKPIPKPALRPERRQGSWTANERLVQPYIELESI
jgi:hypothetical protein